MQAERSYQLSHQEMHLHYLTAALKTLAQLFQATCVQGLALSFAQ